MYRILTEDTNRDGIRKALANEGIGEYTLISGQGSWRGNPEPSLTIEVFGVSSRKIHNVAQAIAIANNQESVIVQSILSRRNYGPGTKTFLVRGAIRWPHYGRGNLSKSD